MNLHQYHFFVPTLDKMSFNPNEPLQQHDYSSGAMQFFLNQKIVSCFMAAATMVGYFHTTSKYNSCLGEKSQWKDFAIGQQKFSFFFSCYLWTMNILLAMAAEITILREEVTVNSNNDSPPVKSSYDLLMRDYKFEFVAIRWASIVSILFFLRGVFLHCALDHHFFDKGKMTQRFMLISAIVSFSAGIFSYINATLQFEEWSDFLGMTVNLMKLKKQMFWDKSLGTTNPMLTISLFAAGMTFSLFFKLVACDGKACISQEKNKNDASTATITASTEVNESTEKSQNETFVGGAVESAKTKQ